MSPDQSALLDLLGQLKLTDVSDRIRTATETLSSQLIESEATVFIGAGPFERFERFAAHTTRRNGSRTRTLTTTAGDRRHLLRSLHDRTQNDEHHNA